MTPQGQQVEIDTQLLGLDAVQVDTGHTGDPFQRLADPPVQQVPGLGEITLGGDTAVEHLGPGSVGVTLDGDAVDLRRESVACALHRLTHLGLLQIDVRLPVELHLDARRTWTDESEDRLHPRDGRHLLLDGPHDLA